MSGWASKVIRSTPEFFQKAFLSFSMRFGGLFIQFLASIVVARLLGAEGYGAYTYAMTWAVLVGMLLPLGLGDLSIRELPGFVARGEGGRVSGYLLMTVVTIAVCGALVAGVFAFLEWREILVLRPGWKLVSAMAVLHALVLTTSHLLNGFQRILTSQFLETIFRTVVYLLLIGFVLLIGLQLTPVGIYKLSIVAAMVALAFMIAVLASAFQRDAGGRTELVVEYRAWIAGAIPLVMTTLANRLQLDLDVLMVGSMMGEYEVGLYRAAARGAALVSVANMVSLQLVAPMLSRALARQDHQEAQRLLSHAAIVSLLSGAPIIALFGIGATFYLHLYGSEFTAASSALHLLLVGQAAIILAGPDAILLIMLKREKTVLLVSAIGVTANFTLNYLLIPYLGMNGAALASMISMAFVRLALVVAILRSTGFNTTVLPALRAFLGR